MYIDEDDIDWDGSAGSQESTMMGTALERIGSSTQGIMWWEEPHRPDANGNGIQCDVIWVIDSQPERSSPLVRTLPWMKTQ